MENVLFAIFCFTGAMLYIAPSLLAIHRRHHDQNAILALNILMGWTCIGYLVVFIWSLTGNVYRPTSEQLKSE